METELRQLQHELCKRLEKVDFSNLWPGFHQYPFALYTAESVLVEDDFFAWDERFMGNTAISYADTYLAIWDVEKEWRQGDIDYDCLASNLVHEMFHAYQRELGDTRCPDDLRLLQYPLDIGNYAWKYEENKRVAAAIRTRDTGEKQKLLAEVNWLRKRRAEQMGSIIQEEDLVETAEGMAEYVGLLALHQIAAEKYAERIEGYLLNLELPTDRQFQIRLSSYYSGALILIAAQKAGLPIHHDIGREKRPFFQLIEKQLTLPEHLVVNPDQAFTERAEKWIEAREVLVRQVKEQLTEWTAGPFRIVGYDPMNMVRVEDTIYCSNFICLQEKANEVVRVIQGKVILEMEKGTSREVSRYSHLC